MSWLTENDCCGSRHDVLNPEVCADCPFRTLDGDVYANTRHTPSWLALTGDRDEWGGDDR